jgi:hypothetical protein
MRIAAIGVSNEIGDSSVDRQSYVAFVIEVVATLGLSIGPNLTWPHRGGRSRTDEPSVLVGLPKNSRKTTEILVTDEQARKLPAA